MKTLRAMLLPIILAACATTHHVSLPVDGLSIDSVNVGDRVKIVMNDGDKQEFQVTRVDELGLYGSDESYAYMDMRSVSVVRPRETKHIWWLLLSIAAIAAFAEPDDGGYGPFCLRSSSGGPCLP